MKTTANITRLKPGGFILIDEFPCRIDKVQSSSSGKHGHAKVRVDATGILDGKRRSFVKPSGEDVNVPMINKNMVQVLSIVGETAQLMDVQTYEVFELPIPEELKGKIQQGTEITCYEIMGVRTLKQIK